MTKRPIEWVPQLSMSRHDLLDKAARVLRDMVPYKRARLTAMKASGDEDAPLFNLSALSDSELAFLRRTVLKATPVDPSYRSGDRPES